MIAPLPAGTRLTLTEAAAYLGLAPKTLRNWRSAGVGPPGFTVGARVWFHAGDLDEWIDQQKAAAAA
ncbi:helix-turn-helix domain-containing protein [Rothia kristinae]|uniref:helix-turn-helix transcriptional regulator n=1 Tax=Actinomycetes TaxID=1760 RepID=UPI00342FEB7D